MENPACSTGEICCSNCTTDCPNQAVACFQYCKSPCPEPPACQEFGANLAGELASQACQETKTECGITDSKSFVFDGVLNFIRKCCEQGLNGCDAQKHRINCSVPDGNYGQSTKADFDTKYQGKISGACAMSICKNSICGIALAGDARCSP